MKKSPLGSNRLHQVRPHSRLLGTIAFGTLLVSTPSALSHGTVSSPASRVFRIYQEGPDSATSPSAVAAIAVAGSNPYYTWNQISQNVPSYNTAAFDSSYASVIPDGQLASGAHVTGAALDFSGLDLVGNPWQWPATPVTAGRFEINWFATATHDPSFFKVWITSEDYDHRSALTWDKMEFLGKLAHTRSGQNYTVPVTLPSRTGRHVLYVAWQRIDPVGEVFFSASDIIFGDSPEDPDAEPVVSVADVVVDEDAGTATAPVTLSKPVAGGSSASVEYSTSDGTATAGDDYTATGGTLRFSGGESSTTITVPIADDANEESNEVFSIELRNPVGLNLGTISAAVTITDNDSIVAGGASWETRDDWGSGYNGWLTVVNSSDSPVLNPTLTLRYPDDARTLVVWGGPTATGLGAGSYSLTGLGTIPAGGSIRIDIGIDNTSGAAVRSPVDIRLNGVPTGALAPHVAITPELIKREGDTDGSLMLEVTLSAAHRLDVHVSYTTHDGTAAAGTDYTATSGTLTFSAGETSKTITVEYRGNTIADGDRTFSVLLAGVDGQTPPRFASATSHQATVTLEDDDSPPTLTATGDTVIEGDSGSRNLVFNLRLSQAAKPGESASIGYSTHGHGATPGTDFTATAGTVSFPPGATTATVEVPVIGDLTDERLELVKLHFQNPSGLVMATTQACGQIIDDEIAVDGFGSQRVVAYVDTTSGTPAPFPDGRVTHIMVAFANLAPGGDLVGGAPQAGAVKADHPAAKVLLSIGGWTWSANFSAIAADPAKRQVFARSCMTACADYNLDGIDLDWEWPGVTGGPGTTPDPSDGANYTLLVQTLRSELDRLAATTGKHYEITAFTAALPQAIAQLQLADLAPLFDFVNVQGYDLRGPWDNLTGHNAGLHHNSADTGNRRLNIGTILQHYVDGGFPRHKLLVAAPFFAQRFYAVDTTAHGAFQSHSGSGDTTLYRNLTAQLKTVPRHWDPHALVPFLYDRINKVWISYDDPQAMYEKALYSRDKGFGGVFFWHSGGDTDDRQLLTTISDTLASVDSDTDGIDDGWEIEHFGDLTTADKTSDFDRDGHTDFTESKFKTDPADGRSSSILEPPLETRGQRQLRFLSFIGVSYQLQSSGDLVHWVNQGDPIEGTGNTIVIENPPATNSGHHYYRIKTHP